MSVFLDKSKTNQKAAELLKQKAMYSSVIHCLYYSCYQRMLHVWVDILGNEESEIRNLPKKTQEGSHEQFINGFRNWMLQKGFPREDLQQLDYIFKLKSLRVKADYKPYPIDQNHCIKSEWYLEVITSTLNKVK